MAYLYFYSSLDLQDYVSWLLIIALQKRLKFGDFWTGNEVNEMAIKVIERGTRRQVRCSKCDALLSYHMNEDVIQEPVDDFLTGRWVRKFIICPECSNKIVLNQRR